MCKRNSWLVLSLIVMVAMIFGSAARADVKKEILGRWDCYKSDAVYLRFYKDGSFRWVTFNEETVGKYRVLDDGVIEYTTHHPRLGQDYGVQVPAQG